MSNIWDTGTQEVLVKLFMQNDLTVVLENFTIDIEYQFFQSLYFAMWHSIAYVNVYGV